jgi:hypothetical protein
MTNATSIRILETDDNRRGDLFARLMADLFVALGYDAPRLNVQKTGRELDLVATHRLERRRAIAECKATERPAGGADLNKFVGSLDAEHDDDRPVTGYFVSLAGFTETAVEQELQRRRTRVVLLDAAQVVRQLIEGRILIPRERATELAGRLHPASAPLTLDPGAELLAHERGWIWVVHYLRGGVRTHFALIRSDGEVLSRAIADQVVAADRDRGGDLHTLCCLNPEPPSPEVQDRAEEAIAAYRRYLASECGFIYLDGLPADADIGSRRLTLEALFVPLRLEVLRRTADQKKEPKKKRLPVGKALAKYSRLALLAPPGGGKSTLLKRLAVAYSDPERRERVADDLPARDWLPLFLRCRDLRPLARGSFADLLDALAQREPLRPHAAAFRAHVDRELAAGRVLLLVDGIDEIGDPGNRAAFMCMLRAALLAYPDTAAVVSSREAGFRQVAAYLASVCTRVRLAPFGDDDISRLTVRWFREVAGHRAEVRTAAEKLAATIVGNDRIRRLAVNPLLLTTLLLVKRWVGSLPTRRALLYGKAVEVLLMTWNVEGHQPIAEDEALPQLCFVAAAMMDSGIQEISRPRLAALLQAAREALPAEFGYVGETVDQFIHRVEDRSSLLMMTGHAAEDGRLVETFEFRHLTFQEFLAARAMVEGWHPGRQETDTLASVLEPHLEDEAWREVVPLAAVLGGKAADPLIQRLTERISNRSSGQSLASPETELDYLALGNCLADEAPAKPETVRAALEQLICRSSLDSAPFTRLLARSRYGRDLRDEASGLFLSAADLRGAGRALAMTVYWQAAGDEEPARLAAAAASFKDLMSAPDRAARCAGALGTAALCWRLQGEERKDERLACSQPLRLAGPALVPLLFADGESEPWAAAWALSEIATQRLWAPPVEPDVLGRLLDLWLHGPSHELQRMAAWALARQPICSRDDGRRCAAATPADLDRLLERYGELSRRREQPAFLAVAWYRRSLSDAELARRARALLAEVGERAAAITLRELLGQLRSRP